MNELARMVAEEAGAAIASAGVAIVPIGATEQHGRHLTLDTDFAIATAFARLLAAELGAAAVLCPGVPYGLSEHHMAFTGTMTLRPATLLAVLHDIGESLAHAGLRRVIVVNGHGGNVDAVRLAARSLRRDHGVQMAHMIWLGLAADTIAAEVGSVRYGHACEAETSVGMVLAPQVVRAERIGPPDPDLPVYPHVAPPIPRVDLPLGYETLAAHGALGDARAASAELGATIVDAAFARAVEFARAFAAGG